MDNPQQRKSASSVSALKIAANRANAKKSTGPKTKLGKARSSVNAVRHGLTAVKVVLEGESPAEFESLRTGMFQEFRPTSRVEQELVDRIASVLWRLRRVPAFEVALLAWVEHSQSRRHDRSLITLGSSSIGDSDRGLPTAIASESYGMGVRRLGRALETALSKHDLLNKLSRYEGQLTSQLDKGLKQLTKARLQKGKRR